jgi:chromosome segregation ATPase
MKHIQRFILSLVALLLFSGVALTVPASARDGGSSGSSGSSDTSTSSSDDSTNPVEVENHAHDLMETFKSNAKANLAEKRAEHQQQTQEHRQQKCEQRKTKLANRMDNALKHAKKHKAVFDKIYTRVKTFHDDKQLQVDNYAELTGKVDTAQTNADAAIAALESLNVDIDCTQPNVADAVSSFQQAVKSARDSLKTYRTALVDLINSLKGASSANSSSTDNSGGEQ